MDVLRKLRGLYRFDGDTEPVQLSRRSFFFVGGVIAAGAAIPWRIPEYVPFAVNPGMDAALMAFWRQADSFSRVAYPAIVPPALLSKGEYARRILKLRELHRGVQWPNGLNGEWLLLDGKVPTTDG